MILATALVFLIGVFLGWLYGQRSGHNELTELRRLRQIGRLDTHQHKRQSSALESPAPNATNGIAENTLLKHARLSPLAIDSSSYNPTALVDNETSELDDLYRISAKVKPLEYDLTQRKIEVKALKQALQDVRRLNEKHLVSVRLQAQNQSGLEYKEKLAEKQKQIDALREKLSAVSNLKSPDLTLQSQNEQEQALELASIKQQLAGTLENLTQSERRVAEVQKAVSGLNQQLNSRSTELEAAQLSLKESVEREVLLSGRLKSLNAQSRRVDVMSGKMEARDRSVNTMMAQLNEHRDLVTDLRTELKTKCEQIDSQKKSLEKIPVLEAKVLKFEQEQIYVREQTQVREQELAEQLDTLQRALNEKDKHIAKLRIQSDRVISLESAAKSRETEIRTLILRIASAEKIEEQLLNAQEKLAAAKHVKADLDRLQSVSSELEQSRLEIKSLSQSLERAQLALVTARENDIELRRLRSERQSLQSTRDSAVNKVHSLERHIQQQERQIATNIQLRERVRELESVAAEKQSKKTKSGTSPKPLYTAPAEKDDLKKINGIGPVMEKMLNSLGVTSFKQVAEFKAEDIRTVTEAIEAFPGRIERDNWIGGAKEQYEKKYRKAADA